MRKNTAKCAMMQSSSKHAQKTPSKMCNDAIIVQTSVLSRYPDAIIAVGSQCETTSWRIHCPRPRTKIIEKEIMTTNGNQAPRATDSPSLLMDGPNALINRRSWSLVRVMTCSAVFSHPGERKSKGKSSSCPGDASLRSGKKGPAIPPEERGGSADVERRWGRGVLASVCKARGN